MKNLTNCLLVILVAFVSLNGTLSQAQDKASCEFSIVLHVRQALMIKELEPMVFTNTNLDNPAVMEVTGDANATVSVQIKDSSVMLGTATVSNLRTDDIISLDSNGKGRIEVLGDMTLPSDLADGDYISTTSITVTYN